MKTSRPTNAIFLGPDGSLTVKQIEEKYEPDGSQSLVQVQYSAINPADIRHSYMGLHGSVAGYEWTGTIIEAANESPFSIGQRLFGVSMAAPQRPISAGAHQDYLIAEKYMTQILPSDLDPKHAVTLPVGMQTGADALFNILGFGLIPAEVSGSIAEGVPILIWGGSSIVGFSTIQLAKIAGFGPIYTTASSKNHDALKKAGADYCFDYKSPNIIDDIRKTVRQSGKDLTTVFDAVSAGLGVYDPPSKTQSLDMTKSTPSLARRCCTDADSTGLNLCAVLPVAHDSTWKFCLGTRTYGDTVLGMSQDPSWPGRVETVMKWIVTNHGLFQPVPNVTVIQGAEDGIMQMNRVFDGKVSLEKVLIARPM